MSTKKIVLAGVTSLLLLWFWYTVGAEFVDASEASKNGQPTTMAPLMCGFSWMISQVVAIMVIFKKEIGL